MKYFLMLLLFIIDININFAQIIIDDNGVIISGKATKISDGNNLFSQNENIRVIPASLIKLITTATALELLGEDYTYKTQFGYTGILKNEILYGDLIVKSGGDATLGSKYFSQTEPQLLLDKIFNILIEAGIKSIEGDVIVKRKALNYPSSRLWEDMGNYYGGAPKSFNWKDNTATVTLQSRGVGELCEIVSIAPAIHPYTMDCRVIAACHRKDSAYVYGISELSKWWIEGSIPSNRKSFNVKAALPDPTQTFINDLIKYLKQQGIPVKGNCLSKEEKQQCFFPLYTHHSPFLSDIIQIINHKSNNLFADQLLLTLAKEFKGYASWDNGVLVVKEFWQDKIDFDIHFRVKDGSGLSPKNLVSAKGMVDVLLWMNKNSESFESFENSLAKGGESGTLKTVFRDAQIKGKIIGKSGSMEGVLGYCGYLSTKDKERTVFCIIVNNYLKPTKEIRVLLDELITNWVLKN